MAPRIPLSLYVALLIALHIPRMISSPDNLYDVLGVSRTATTAEIKSAYRRKARDTHPDKRRHIDADVAAADFRRVVDAFEVLSDQASRERYDRTGSADGSSPENRGTRQGGYGSWNFHGGRYHYRRRQLKDEPRVKEAQSRVMHVVSMTQLETVMLDDASVLERNLLMCFLTPTIERVVEDDILFPYPFAGMSSQQIWWEDLLQTVMVRYNRENDLSRFFAIPHGEELSKSGMPMFVFIRRGEPLSKFTTFSTSDRASFENWVWEQLQVEVEFVNNHTHAVELYWIHNTRAKLRSTLQPGKTHRELTMLSHEYYARDDRVDRQPSSPGRWKLSTSSSIGSWKIISDELFQRIVINTPQCMDLSGHCEFWVKATPGECERNPGFMLNQCPLSCNACDQENDIPRTRDEL